MNWDRFKELNIDLNDFKKNQLLKYKNLLQEENKIHNLTAIIKDQEILDKHFFDSLLFTKVFNPENLEILDIGTGAGFPGIVIKILYPNTKIYLLESNGKKIDFLKKVILELDLKNIWTLNARAEEYSIENKEKFDVIISRAMAPLNILLEVGVQSLKLNGTFICLKSKNVNTELQDLNSQEKKLGLKLFLKQELYDEVLGERNNLFYSKENQTPLEFPRHYSQIRKRPLGK
ncbi:16S rRNA (guanine(527)-N(7))-methyltransferase RsmG [Spiroplasma cantharicola]|uniref:Ribosomal RNA small subunit methyltransferase G n=1 Tax=Spiroplasma cantharicola TaxID=362837 RepID=A0A0M3SJK2_9MOLU|nr:16S rRNA (guanine(527)-N(7))-methyltransferase RsmG [Spiroplasma cantharicola]ALD66898.1 16S rRNA methyltransferase GidB [Spiroplasma cantharicola]